MEVQSKTQQLTQAQDVNASLTREVQEVQARCAYAESGQANSERELAQCRGNLRELQSVLHCRDEERKQFLQHNETVAAQLRDAEHSIQQEQALRAQIQSEVEARDQYIDEIAAKLHEAHHHNNVLREENDQLRLSFQDKDSELAQAMDAIHAEQSRLQTFQADMDAQGIMVQSAREREAQLDQELSSMNAKYHHLQRQCEKLQNHAIAAESMAEEERKKTADLKGIIQSTRGDAMAMDQTNRELEAKVQELEARIQELCGTLGDHDNQCAKLVTSQEQLERDLAQTRRDLVSALRQRDETNDIAKRDRGLVDQLQATIAQLQRSFDASQSEVIRLQDESVRARDQAVKTEQQLRVECDKRIAGKDADYAALQYKYSRLLSDNSRLQAQAERFLENR